MSKFSTNEIKCYICNVFSHWDPETWKWPFFFNKSFLKYIFIDDTLCYKEFLLKCIDNGFHWWLVSTRPLGADSIKRYHLTSIGNPIVEIRRSYDRLISTMGFPILVRWHLYIESGPWSLLRRRRLIGTVIPIINLGRLSDRFRFIMGVPIPVRRRHFSEERPT